MKGEAEGGASGWKPGGLFRGYGVAKGYEQLWLSLDNTEKKRRR